MSRTYPLIVIGVMLIAAPVVPGQEVKTFDCDGYGTPCFGSYIPTTATSCNLVCPACCMGPMDNSVITIPAALGPNCVITDLDVSIDLFHFARGDLTVTLVGPDATSVQLWTAVGGLGDHVAVTIDDEATTSEIQAGICANPAFMCLGPYRPTAPALLSAFDGLNPAGDWTLVINDGVIHGPPWIDVGALLGWSLRMTFADTDGDQVFDCDDLCPSDAGKSSAGACGCGTADTDTDGDGVADCRDGCPNDAAKLAPGVCGCGTADLDVDGDGILGCRDNCPNDANPDQADTDGNGVGNVCEAPGAPAPGPCGLGVVSVGMLGLCSLCGVKLMRRRRRARAR